MDLPLANEIREARRLAEEARDAAAFDARVGAALLAVDVLQRRVDYLDASTQDLPADDLINELVERWDPLVDLAAIGPRATHSLPERLHLRRQQLQSAHQYLGPLGREAGRLAHEMEELQHEQAHLLQDPKYQDDMAEITTIANERAEVQFELSPLSLRLDALGPTTKVVTTFIERIVSVRGQPMDLPGGQEWRAALVARDILDAIGVVLGQYNPELRPPPAIVVPEYPDPERAAELDALVSGALADCEQILERLVQEKTIVGRDTARLQQRFDELNQHLLDRMG